MDEYEKTMCEGIVKALTEEVERTRRALAGTSVTPQDRKELVGRLLLIAQKSNETRSLKDHEIMEKEYDLKVRGQDLEERKTALEERKLELEEKRLEKESMHKDDEIVYKYEELKVQQKEGKKNRTKDYIVTGVNLVVTAVMSLIAMAKTDKHVSQIGMHEEDNIISGVADKERAKNGLDVVGFTRRFWK